MQKVCEWYKLHVLDEVIQQQFSNVSEWNKVSSRNAAFEIYSESITRMRSNPRYKLGRISFFFFFFFVMVVANCNASCDWLYVRCSQWELLLFFHLDSSLHLSQYGRFHAVSFESTNPQLAAKCEQI